MDCYPIPCHSIWHHGKKAFDQREIMPPEFPIDGLMIHSISLSFQKALTSLGEISSILVSWIAMKVGLFVVICFMRALLFILAPIPLMFQDRKFMLTLIQVMMGKSITCGWRTSYPIGLQECCRSVSWVHLLAHWKWSPENGLIRWHCLSLWPHACLCDSVWWVEFWSVWLRWGHVRIFLSFSLVSFAFSFRFPFWLGWERNLRNRVGKVGQSWRSIVG